MFCFLAHVVEEEREAAEGVEFLTSCRHHWSDTTRVNHITWHLCLHYLGVSSHAHTHTHTHTHTHLPSFLPSIPLPIIGHVALQSGGSKWEEQVTQHLLTSMNSETTSASKADHTRTRQLLSPATRQHYFSCVLRMKYRMLHSTSCLRIDSPSISKRLVECTMRYFHAQYTRKIMLACCRQQKLPRVWSA